MDESKCLEQSQYASQTRKPARHSKSGNRGLGQASTRENVSYFELDTRQQHPYPCSRMPAPPPVSNPLPLVERQLIVFDFDWSLADQDTDRWVHECLAPDLRVKMKNLMNQVQFTDLCASLLDELHQRGVSQDQIKQAMQSMPIHPQMVKSVKSLKASPKPDTTFFLLSNSNEYYIRTLLQKHELSDVFTEVVTNPAQFDDKGKLCLRRRIPADAEVQHACKVGCSANMCKGAELDSFLERHGGRSSFQRIIYVGDGGNDYCPVKRLTKSDLALVRRGRGLEKRIEAEPVDCEIRKWSGAWEMHYLLGDLHKQE